MLPLRAGGTARSSFAFDSHHRHPPICSSSEVTPMLGWAITFLLVALVAAVFGFGGIAGTAVEIAKLIFFVAIVLFAISAVIGLLRGRSPM
jgi:uncharacterized membrane protein YtjA (UPF0391 family)